MDASSCRGRLIVVVRASPRRDLDVPDRRIRLGTDHSENAGSAFARFDPIGQRIDRTMAADRRVPNFRRRPKLRCMFLPSIFLPILASDRPAGQRPRPSRHRPTAAVSNPASRNPNFLLACHPASGRITVVRGRPDRWAHRPDPAIPDPDRSEITIRCTRGGGHVRIGIRITLAARVIGVVRGQTPRTAENSVGRSFPPRRRWLRSDLSATASPSLGSFGVPAARGWTESSRFRWKTSVGRSTCPGRRSASIGSSGIGIPESEKNVRLLARNRVVTAMAGPDRIPGRWTRKKMLATAAAAR
jgi:hypothetical protein